MKRQQMIIDISSDSMFEWFRKYWSRVETYFEDAQRRNAHEDMLDSEIAVVRKVLLERYSSKNPENVSYGAVLFGVESLGDMTEEERNGMRDMMKKIMQHDINTTLSAKEEHYEVAYHQ